MLSEDKYQASINPLSGVNIPCQKQATTSTARDTSGESYTLLAEMAFLFTWFFQNIFLVDQRINYHPQMFPFFSQFPHTPANS